MKLTWDLKVLAKDEKEFLKIIKELEGILPKSEQFLKTLSPTMSTKDFKELIDFSEKTKEKIALFWNVDKNHVISDPNLDTVYDLPIVFKNEKELIQNFPESDIVVATHWSTASWVSNILSEGKAKKGVYFLQDYQSWFFQKSDIESRAVVKDTYAMIEHKIVKSSWLQEMIQNDGFQSKKIWLGMNLDVFYSYYLYN